MVVDLVHSGMSSTWCRSLGATLTKTDQMFTLEQVVPWGRSFDEYCRMFALSDDDLTLRILGCGDGPASFNAEANRRGKSSVWRAGSESLSNELIE